MRTASPVRLDRFGYFPWVAVGIIPAEQGTHNGDFMGMPATGKAFTYDEIIIVRFKDGKIIEHWAETDSMGMMQ